MYSLTPNREVEDSRTAGIFIRDTACFNDLCNLLCYKHPLPAKIVLKGNWYIDE